MRYLPLTAPERQSMLAAIGVGAIDDLFCDVPASARWAAPDLPPHQGEMEVERALVALSGRNVAAGAVPFFCGAGAYRHHVPATVDHLIQRSEFLTSYTPYQPEISQGTLQYLFEFQSQVALLTGMEVANASLYDGSTACAEAVLMAQRVTKRERALLSGGLHPHYRDVVRTMTAASGEQIVHAPADPAGREDLAGQIDDRTACVVVQYPDVFGNLRDLRPLAEATHRHGALLVAIFNEPVAFGAVLPPGAMGADIVAGEGQPIGNTLNFGGPYLGLFATQEKFLRQMPGRLCGETVDADGRHGFVLTLSAREQHIRREKATSNICTNSGLCALAFTIHMALLGEIGLRKLARLNHASAVRTAALLAELSEVEVLNESFFNEFTIRVPRPGADVVEGLARRGILGGVPAARLFPDEAGLDDLILVASTETNTESDRTRFAAALREVLSC